jgi:hypothetical protein
MATPKPKPVTKPKPKPVRKPPAAKPVKAAPKPKPVKKSETPPVATAATRPPGTGVTPKPTGPPQINTDSVENMKAGMVAVGEYLKAPARAIIADLVIGYQENTWNISTCNRSNHCGLYQLNSGWQAEHDYQDVTYWTYYAYKNGFYSHGGLIAIADNYPDIEIGLIVQYCQGAGPGPGGQLPQAYYQEAVPEATADYNRLKGQTYTGGTTGGYSPSGPSTPAQTYDAGSAASFYKWPGNYASASTQLDSGATRGSTRANAAFDYANSKKYLTAPRKKG